MDAAIHFVRACWAGLLDTAVLTAAKMQRLPGNRTQLLVTVSEEQKENVGAANLPRPDSSAPAKAKAPKPSRSARSAFRDAARTAEQGAAANATPSPAEWAATPTPQARSDQQAERATGQQSAAQGAIPGPCQPTSTAQTRQEDAPPQRPPSLPHKKRLAQPTGEHTDPTQPPAPMAAPQVAPKRVMTSSTKGGESPASKVVRTDRPARLVPTSLAAALAEPELSKKHQKKLRQRQKTATAAARHRPNHTLRPPTPPQPPMSWTDYLPSAGGIDMTRPLWPGEIPGQYTHPPPQRWHQPPPYYIPAAPPAAHNAQTLLAWQQATMQRQQYR